MVPFRLRVRVHRWGAWKSVSVGLRVYISKYPAGVDVGGPQTLSIKLYNM